jgi:peptide/nickel transport system substrate-binding protein
LSARWLRHVVVGIAACTGSHASAQTLVMGMGSPVTSIDPHFSNAAPNSAVAMHIFDRLIERAADAHLVPGLAESWAPVSDMVWEFHLRHGVKWQDGTEFSASDVAFTLQRVPRLTATIDNLAGYLRSVAGVDIVDPTTIRITTKGPAPDLPDGLSLISIISRQAATGASTADFNSGKAAIGTGPFRLVRFVPGESVELARNDLWWGPKPVWEHAVYRVIANPGSRVAALLAGDVAIIDQVSPADVPRLGSDASTKVVSVDGLRALFLALNTQNETGAPWMTGDDGKPLPANPLRDLRVRQALSLAINRDALAEHTMEGGATPNGQFLPKGTFGYDPDLAHPRYDAQGARDLLSAAGYPRGFHLTVQTSNDRFLNDAATMQAVAQMWSRIGVRTQVDAMPWSSYASRGVRREFAVSYWAWGNNTAEAGNTLLNLVGTPDAALHRGGYNNGGYANAALDALIDQALGTVDRGAREALLLRAVRMESDDVAVIHLYQIKNIWAMRRDLDFVPRVDQRTLATYVRPAP